MITKILASTVAISFALTTTAFAQDKSTTDSKDGKTEAVEQKAAGPLALGLGAIVAVGAANDASGEGTGAPDEQVMGSGSGAGKANFQDLSLAASPSGGEDRLTENLGISGGEDRLTENVTLNFGKARKIEDIQGESQDKAYIKFDGVEGESIDKAMAADVNEQVTLAFGANEAPACVTESGAADADCNGVPDSDTINPDSDATNKDTRVDRRDIRKRPEPRQQRR